ncbi:hypothetical protein SAMN05444395_10515 [Flavobacterium fryxellicola]|uniref:Uncharacterized protein n=1 Tax=Flavobacterium fryxellicola TaxID=249352 RepID=A0A167UZB1_9FLAO|nr:hypothetical protein [Flavobacterium fryxellicola]OAB25943.1 hypothetical protein FBFR_13565 [Flavobacterium fryxellicola]SHN68995.1 hypothetical protein SAMN05444395_10515 [Flavobacterium fryxellicola]
MAKARCFDIALIKFKEIQNRFPHLIMTLDYDDEFVDLSMEIPKQSGIDFDICLNLQNEDELHIVTNYLWCQFFSAHSELLVEKFFESVVGLINGNYRILQYVRNDEVYKAFLQKPKDDNWETIYKGYQKIRMPWTTVKKNVIQNGKDSKLITIHKVNS